MDNKTSISLGNGLKHGFSIPWNNSTEIYDLDLFGESLSGFYATMYPNPSREDQNDHLTFANLTPQAQITIMTIAGKKIATVTEQQANGGVEWNMLDDSGRHIETGIYLYYATGTNSSGNTVEPKVGKFAVVR